MNILDMIAWR